MRSRYKVLAAGIHFTTSTIVDFIPILNTDKYKSIITDTLLYSRTHKGLNVFGYVVMSDHFHLLVSADDLPQVMQQMMSFLGHQIVKHLKADKQNQSLQLLAHYKKSYKNESEYQIWQEGYHPQLVERDDVLEQKLNYIHFNPMRKGLVQEPEDWLYSSARNYAWGNDQGVMPIDLLCEVDKVEDLRVHSQAELGNEKNEAELRNEKKVSRQSNVRIDLVSRQSLGTRIQHA